MFAWYASSFAVGWNFCATSLATYNPHGYHQDTVFLSRADLRAGRGGDFARERQEGPRDRATNQGFGLLDVFMAKEKLAIEVTQIDCVKIDDVDFAKASEDEVFEQLTADAAGADEENARLDRGEKTSVSDSTRHRHVHKVVRDSMGAHTS